MIHMILCPGTVEESDCMWYLLQEHLSYDKHVLKSTHALFQKKKSSVLMDNVVGPLLASSLPTQVLVGSVNTQSHWQCSSAGSSLLYAPMALCVYERIFLSACYLPQGLCLPVSLETCFLHVALALPVPLLRLLLSLHYFLASLRSC